MTSNVLPAKPILNSSHTTDASQLKSGTWWRLEDPDHALHQRTWVDDQGCPDHGLVLQVREVRIFEGEIHTVVLRPHPRWQQQRDALVLAEDFFSSFCFSRSNGNDKQKEAEILNDTYARYPKATDSMQYTTGRDVDWVAAWEITARRFTYFTFFILLCFGLYYGYSFFS